MVQTVPAHPKHATCPVFLCFINRQLSCAVAFGVAGLAVGVELGPIVSIAGVCVRVTVAACVGVGVPACVQPYSVIENNKTNTDAVLIFMIRITV